ncbi:MAG TPA: family 20 glycosylhydrolase, partial [Pyrinomonadaceae bacterium]|nr:family 20 glycosylhydrolase [Pyrinomonadaceae bacterium]
MAASYSLVARPLTVHSSYFIPKEPSLNQHNMKILIATLVIALLLGVSAFAQSDDVNIVPRPQKIVRGDGYFTLTPDTRILARGKADKAIAALLVERLQKAYGITIKISSKRSSKSPYIVFLPTVPDPRVSVNDGYGLAVEEGRIAIEGVTAAGRFYGLQSLLQLLPSSKDAPIRVPVVRIDDHARFRYRGMHLDVARHFEPVEFVKKFVDLMSQYKLNYFHWHLTDDQGWRIPITKYPELTEIGSTRPETVKERNLTPYIGDGIPHGGFYTHEQIKDVIAYAKERHITVVPEIELPGHASAALAAYPQFGCRTDYK